MNQLSNEFFARDAVSVARELVGKRITHTVDGIEYSAVISETEAYLGTTDSACHAYKGVTKRTEILFRDAGTVYVYLCYGMHWLMNIVCGNNDGHCVLLRAGIDAKGPALFTRKIHVTGAQNGIMLGDELKIYDSPLCEFTTAPRVGIKYARPEDRDAHLRFILKL